MKFGFVTCVQLGLSCLEAIYEVDGNVDLVITLNDDLAANKSGRVYLDDFCKKQAVSLFKSSHINNEEVIKVIRENDIDWLFIIGWSQIASRNVLRSVKKGVIGAHPTLLPIGRGSAAIPWAIIKGLKETGVTFFKMDEGVDTGQIIAQVVIPLSETTNATELYDAVNSAHIELMKDTFPALNRDAIKLVEQDEAKATVWPGRKPEDGRIDINGSVYDAERLIRAVTKPYPGAYIVREGQKIIVWSAEIIPIGEIESGLEGATFYDGFLKFVDYEICDRR